MRAVLGIDAAWTLNQPSGVAVAVGGTGGWLLRAIAPSYDEFSSSASTGRRELGRARGSMPDAKKILEAAHRKAGSPISLVAVDMPLSTEPITKRRKADDDVTHHFVSKGAGTHSPSDRRPGKLSEELRQAFEAGGFRLATHGPIVSPALIEVYPHPALIVLDDADFRLLYKLRKYRKAQRAELTAIWHRILLLLDRKIDGCVQKLPLPHHGDPTHKLKAFEDMLDAVVCCWVGICALDGRACALGDETAAIWIPKWVQ